MKYFQFKYTLVRIIVATLIILGTLYLPTILQGSTDHYQAAFGQPQTFVIQSQNIDPPHLPWVTHRLNFRDHPIYFSVGKFVLNVLHIWVLIELAAILDRKWRARWCASNKGHRSWKKYCSRFE